MLYIYIYYNFYIYILNTEKEQPWRNQSSREKFWDKSHLKFNGARQSIPFEDKSNYKSKM